MDDYLLGARPAPLPRAVGLRAAERRRARAARASACRARPPNAARHLRELWEMIPPNPERAGPPVRDRAARPRAASRMTESCASGVRRPKQSIGRDLLREQHRSSRRRHRAARGDARAARSGGCAIAGRAERRSAPWPPSAGAQRSGDGQPEMQRTNCKSDARGRCRARQALEHGKTGERSSRARTKASRSDCILRRRCGEAQRARRPRLLPPARADEGMGGEQLLPAAASRSRTPELVTVNAFWRDYAAWDGEGRVRLAERRRGAAATSPR